MSRGGDPRPRARQSQGASTYFSPLLWPGPDGEAARIVRFRLSTTDSWQRERRQVRPRWNHHELTSVDRVAGRRRINRRTSLVLEELATRIRIRGEERPLMITAEDDAARCGEHSGPAGIAVQELPFARARERIDGS